MAARYALVSAHVHNTVTGKDEYVHQGGNRDSATQIVTQAPALFKSAPLVAGPDCTGVLAQYLLTYGSGP